MKKADAKLDNCKYLEVGEPGSGFKTSYSSRLVFGSRIIALDEMEKCLLVVDTDDRLNPSYVIDLNNLTSVTIKRSYGSINRGALRNKGIEEFLQRIDLQFEFGKSYKTISLPFYDCHIDERRDRQKLDGHAKYWQMILSRLIGSQTDKK
jgi:hypothetical protein